MTRLYSSTLLEIRVRPAQLTAILKVLNLGGNVPGFQNRIEESTQLIGGFNPSKKILGDRPPKVEVECKTT